MSDVEICETTASYYLGQKGTYNPTTNIFSNIVIANIRDKLPPGGPIDCAGLEVRRLGLGCLPLLYGRAGYPDRTDTRIGRGNPTYFKYPVSNEISESYWYPVDQIARPDFRVGRISGLYQFLISSRVFDI